MGVWFLERLAANRKPKCPRPPECVKAEDVLLWLLAETRWKLGEDTK